MIQRYDAARPKVVSLSIENGSQTVDPGLKEITVRFDRPVRETGWSLVPIFDPWPTPQTIARVPKITWQSWGAARIPFERGVGLDSVGTTLHFGVELEPGRAYEFQLNTPHGFGVRDARTDVPLAPYRISFKTR
jgi:hypothetical protein